MQYIVQTVSGSDLPEGVGRVIVEREDGEQVLLISGEPARCWAFMQAAQEEHGEPCTQQTHLVPEYPPLVAI